MSNIVLAIETSCDDTSVAIVGDNGWVHSLVSANQDLIHTAYGGIVPELAGRGHVETLLPLVDEALKRGNKRPENLAGIIVTNRPGLMGSLLVGVVTAKTLAQLWNKPLLGVNHLEGHLLAPFLRDNQFEPPLDFSYPYLGLAISGGHTSLYHIHQLGHYQILGKTRDDAAGEALDKFAKMIGLGFPGGPQVDKLSLDGNPSSFHFPRGLIGEENYDMSFSGIKSAAQRMISSLSKSEIEIKKSDLCASFQEAIVEVLLAKLNRAVVETGLKRAIITGGVSANSRLRAYAQQWAGENKIQLVIPPLRYCTDNAAMVGYVGALRLGRGERSDLELAPSPNSQKDDFQ